MEPTPRKIVRIGVPRGDGYAMGPGKADLLDAIHATGSISAAGRSLGMSYRRAWLLVDEMNHAFAGPLVEAHLGGAGGGGAKVTQLGLEALQRYRELQDVAWVAVHKTYLDYCRLLKPEKS
jgi:molybdate transport system regulatory protein